MALWSLVSVSGYNVLEGWLLFSEVDTVNQLCLNWLIWDLFWLTYESVKVSDKCFLLPSAADLWADVNQVLISICLLQEYFNNEFTSGDGKQGTYLYLNIERVHVSAYVKGLLFYVTRPKGMAKGNKSTLLPQNNKFRKFELMYYGISSIKL